MTLYTYDPTPPEEPEGSRFWPFVAGAIAGALIVAIVWWGASAFTPDDERPTEATGSTGHQTSALSGTPESDEAPSDEGNDAAYLERCREVFAAQEQPLKAAAASLDQWEVHIGAMNKLVTGAITFQQATQFWNQTRVGASSRLKRAAAARQLFGHRTARCPAPTSTVRLLPEERACRHAVQARNRTMSLATKALGTWQVHVHHMEMLRRGEMTAEEATQLWLQSWRTGDTQVRAYREAARTAAGAGCCPGTSSPGGTACG